MKDISTREDIVLMVDSFYTEVRKDELLGPVFAHFVGAHWEEHLPKMYDFWEGIAFGVFNRNSDTMGVHMNVHREMPLTALHFQRWLSLFETNTNALFNGSKTEEIIHRANTIAQILQHKLSQLT